MNFSVRLGVLLVLTVGIARTGGSEAAASIPKAPRLSPDYADVVIPLNIAPLNFTISEPGETFRVQIHGAHGNPISIEHGPDVRIPEKSWHALLEANAGANLFFDISVRNELHEWSHFATVTNRIANEPVDGYLVYRLLKPLYNTFTHLGIYQRNLATFEENVVLHNRSFQEGCVNCHSFLNYRPDHMTLQIRQPKAGNPMLLVHSNSVIKVARSVGYTSWHPSGRLIAYSANKLSLFYHTISETRDVFDAESNLGIYRIDQNRIVIPPAIARADRLETWPSWSPDGKHLYFCSAPPLPLDRYREIRYDLMRISYDIDQDLWGELETVVKASETGLSAAQPRLSPDGQNLLFCLSKYGHFPIYQPSSDLYLLNLESRHIERLDSINSPEADTWHCWSSNGRWIVFSSKRRDGLFARPYFSYFDTKSHFSKPLLLPQKDPAFYDSFIQTYNVPELIQEPIRIPESAFAEAILAPKKVYHPQMDTNGTPAQLMSSEVDAILSEAKERPATKEPLTK